MLKYLVVYAILAAWIFRDAASRKTAGVKWALPAVLFAPFVLPLWLAKRPLKSGEVREGGTAWNFFKNFAVVWTLVLAVGFIVGMAAASTVASSASSDAELAGAGLGMAIGGFFIFAVWAVGAIGSLVLGLLLKKSSIVERGPTGPLAQA